MNRETSLMRSIRLVLNLQRGVRVVRNNTGEGELVRGGYVLFGLGQGGADLVGILAPQGRALAFEVKVPGARTAPQRREQQERWREAFRRFGGFACVVISVEEALAALARAREGEAQ